jgi:hypothetical protein
MMERIKRRLAEKARTKLATRDRVDLSIFKNRPSTRLLVGLSMMGLSYVTCWPVITVLGALAFKLGEPLVFSIGAPVAYIFSHLLFIAGTLVAGSEGVMYSRVFIDWFTYNAYRKLLGADLAPSTIGADLTRQDSGTDK